ncbi:MAG TPA: DNA replication and repair protein RecF [Gemmatimonadaceae bacterium]|nr:DNA replication and repair protein RecF [Gemmatimonadaceae bacterium]
MGWQLTEQQAPAEDVRLTSLGVRHFRNLTRVDLELPEEGIAVVGDNGHGKTNLLEAMGYFAIMRSLRGVRDRDLLQFGHKVFSLSGEAHGAAALGAGPVRMTVGFEVAPRAVRKQVTFDGVPVRRLSDAFGAIPSIVIAPRDVILVGGTPGERRRYLDVLLAMTDRRYLSALQRYRAALVRRNATLRHAAPGDAAREREIGVWEQTLAEAGAIVRAARERWLRRYGPRIATLCEVIGERAAVTLRYAARPEASAWSEEPGLESAEDTLRAQLASALENDRPRDIRRQATHAGPHRDDLAISLGGHPLRLVGSAGQQRTVAIALRLAARETVRDAIERLPLMLLDDPFAELDVTRSARILDLLRDPNGHGVGQIVIAIPRADELPRALAPLKRLTIRDGVVYE